MGETKFQPRECPRSGSKAIDIEERESESQYLSPEIFLGTNMFCQKYFQQKIYFHIFGTKYFPFEIWFLFQALYVALIKATYLDYRKAFQTTEDISSFKKYLKKRGANNNYRMGVQFQGKATHSAVALKVSSVSRDLQKRLVKTVSTHTSVHPSPKIKWLSELQNDCLKDKISTCVKNVFVYTCTWMAAHSKLSLPDKMTAVQQNGYLTMWHIDCLLVSCNEEIISNMILYIVDLRLQLKTSWGWAEDQLRLRQLACNALGCYWLQ